MRKLWFVIVATVVSVLVLTNVTHTQVQHQREVMNDQIQHITLLLEGRARRFDDPAYASMQDRAIAHFFIYNQSDVVINTRLYYALPPLEMFGQNVYHYNLIVEHSNVNVHFQPQLPAIEEVAEMHAYCVCRHAPMRSDSRGMVQFTLCFAIDDNQFYMIGVAQAFPRLAVVRQLWPVYIMTALLLLALIFVQQKLMKISKEIQDA